MTLQMLKELERKLPLLGPDAPTKQQQSKDLRQALRTNDRLSEASRVMSDQLKARKTS